MRINHNIPALRAFNQMNKTNTVLDKTLERLSSGIRINRAADDAAGLAITQKMDTQVRGLKQAAKNAMDGISLIQTAEGALNEVHAMLQRVRELSVQVSNGTYDATDRKAVQDEVAQLQDEIARISEHIEFNERKLLNGEIDRRAFPDNKNVKMVSLSDTVKPGEYSIDITQDATKAKLTGDDIDVTGPAIGEAGKININGEEIEILATDTAEVVFDKLRTLAETVGANVLAYDAAGNTKSFEFTTGTKLVFEMKEFGSDYSLEINSDNIDLLKSLGFSNGDSDTGEDVKAELTPANKFSTTATVSTKGNIVTIKDINNFELKVEVADNAVDNLPAGETVLTSNVIVLDAGPLDLQIGANEGQFMEIRIPNLSPKALGIHAINLSTASGAQKAVSAVDSAINTISSIRSKLGAYQNRLEHTISNLDVAAENMTESLSRILDADMAEEMATYTQKNVLAQAGVSMLAQANQRPQSVLQLLNQ